MVYFVSFRRAVQHRRTAEQHGTEVAPLAEKTYPKWIAAYFCRFVARNIVRQGIAKRVEIYANVVEHGCGLDLHPATVVACLLMVLKNGKIHKPVRMRPNSSAR